MNFQQKQTQSFIIADNKATQYLIVRQGNNLILNKRFHSITIDSSVLHIEKDYPWVGDYFQLGTWFIEDNAKKVLFSMVLLNQEKLIPMVGESQGAERIAIGTTLVDAIKIRVSVPDLRAVFWESTLWFRKSDGVLVKSRIQTGMLPWDCEEMVLDVSK